ncbi:MAG: hypothetical protein ACLT0O_10360 [Sutterella wadsworthensis]
MPIESNDWADYVLPSTFFLENPEYLGVSYARDGWVQKSDSTVAAEASRPATTSGSSSRSSAACIRTRRARGLRRRNQTREEWLKWYNEGLLNKAWAKFIAGRNKTEPGGRRPHRPRGRGKELRTRQGKAYETFRIALPS